jgi:predicted RND superfamily exporter protein
MWYRIADWVIRFRVILLIVLFAITGVMGYFASKVEMSYDFTAAIPTDNPRYQEYQDFKNTFGDDGTNVVIGIQTPDLFKPEVFNDYVALTKTLRNAKAVEHVLGLPSAVVLAQDSTGKLGTANIFPKEGLTAENADSVKKHFLEQTLYKGLFYNEQTNAYLMMVSVNKDVLASKERLPVINNIKALADQFGEKHQIEMHYSGLPYIRTQMANKVQQELQLFLLLSFAFTALILLLFFRSMIAVLTSMIVVAIGVVWSFGTLAILGYKITILTGVIPPLVVVIGIPNCVYFLNKYHTEYAIKPLKMPALREMVGKMGIVTLFTNLTAAIGFGVFFFTKSVILKEFGLVAGLNIMALFFISLIFIPAIYLKPPSNRHTGYLESKWLNGILDSFTIAVFQRRKLVYAITIALCGIAVVGMLKLKAVGRIVDDLPQSDKIYTDLKFFEKNFKGVMPLEIIIDTKKKYGALTSLNTWEKMDELTAMLEARPEIGAALSLVKGVKFAKQGFTGTYELPSSFEFTSLRPRILSTFRNRDGEGKNNQLNKLLFSLVDSTGQRARLSVQIADIGSVAMPQLLDSIRPQAEAIFDTADYKLTFTGTSITFLEGSKFIINSLAESLMWAFAMILVCMIVLFRSWKIVLIALAANIVPLVITAGIMGWLGIALKPSTVLVFLSILNKN